MIRALCSAGQRGFRMRNNPVTQAFPPSARLLTHALDLPRASVTFLAGENGSGKLALPGAITYVKNAKKYNTDDKKDVHVVDRIFL